MRLFILLLVAVSARAVTIPTLAGIVSIAASSEQIVREGHNLFVHPIRTLRRHAKDIKAAAKGEAVKPAPVAPAPRGVI